MRKNLLIALLALLTLAGALAAFSYWTGTGPVAQLLGAAEGSDGQPRAAPTCGFYWRTMEPANPSKEYDELHSVAAVSPVEVWAVGTYGTEEYALTLIERWDGTKWTHVASPSVPQFSNHLYSVAATPDGDVWAVGASHRGTDVWQTLVLHKPAGSSDWSIVPSPNVAVITSLNGVVALSDSNVWAAGEYSRGTKGKGSQTLLMHWDGKAWTVVPSPNPTQNSSLTSVIALSPNELWAAGASTGATGASISTTCTASGTARRPTPRWS